VAKGEPFRSNFRSCFRRLLEVQDDSCGEAAVVLGVAEEARLQEVALKAPRDERHEFVVEAAAEGFRERSVRGGVAGGTDADVTCSEQGMREGADFSY